MNRLWGPYLLSALMISCGNREAELSSRVSQLEKENARLEELWQSADNAAVEFGLALGRISEELAELTSQEISVLEVLEDPDFGNPSSERNDLQFVLQTLESMERQLLDSGALRKQLRALESRLRQAEESASASAELQVARLAQFEKLVEAKERTVERLNALLSEKIQQIAELNDEIELQREENRALDAEVGHKDGLIDRLTGTLGQGYLLVGTKAEISNLRTEGVLRRRLWIIRPGPRAYTTADTGRGFRSISIVDLEAIPLGKGLRSARVVSEHGKHPSLFRIRPGRTWELEILDGKFWSISRYLVVRVKR